METAVQFFYMLKNTTTIMQRGRTFLVINGMPPWTLSEQMPGLTAYEKVCYIKKALHQAQ